MIEFHTWLSQIIGYCALITDSLQMRRAWVEKDFSGTSVTDFDELYEQIFDDLDSDRIEDELPTFSPADRVARTALLSFLSALHDVDRLREVDSTLKEPRDLLGSDAWRRVEETAARVKSLLG